MKYEQQLAERLSDLGAITSDEKTAIIQNIQNKKFSLHWELRVLLYIGISLFTGGLGIFIYNNIGSIGHIILIFLLFASCVGCYVYAFKKGLPYSTEAVQHTNPFYDYVVLLGGLLFVSSQGYLQFQFEVYGNQWSLATLVSSFVLFATAFRFDHKGVLSIGISLFAAFFGLVVTPLDWMQSTQYEVGDSNYIQAALVLGILLYGFGWLCRNRNIKPHFVMVFVQFAANILLITMLSGIFSSESAAFMYSMGLFIVGFVFFKEAQKAESFALLLSVVLALYIGISYWVFKILFMGDSLLAVYVAFMYIIASGVGIIYLLRNHKKVLHYATV